MNHRYMYCGMSQHSDAVRKNQVLCKVFGNTFSLDIPQCGGRHT